MFPSREGQLIKWILVKNIQPSLVLTTYWSSCPDRFSKNWQAADANVQQPQKCLNFAMLYLACLTQVRPTGCSNQYSCWIMIPKYSNLPNKQVALLFIQQKKSALLYPNRPSWLSDLKKFAPCPFIRPTCLLHSECFTVRLHYKPRLVYFLTPFSKTISLF